MAQQQIQAHRTKATVVTDLEQARKHRDFAARTMQVEEWRGLVEKIDDLLAELYNMRVNE